MRVTASYGGKKKHNNKYSNKFRGYRKPSIAALELAKRNAHMYYPVVGVLEMFDHFLHALEVLMPHYFDGARVIHSEMRGKYYTVAYLI